MTPAAPGGATSQRYHSQSSTGSQQKSSTAPKFVFFCYFAKNDFVI